MWLEFLCWIDHVWSSKECVCCACDPSVRPDYRECLLIYSKHDKIHVYNY